MADETFYILNPTFDELCDYAVKVERNVCNYERVQQIEHLA